MRHMIERLARDSWVVGIAAAIAIGYAAVRLVSAIVQVVLGIIDGDEGSGRFVIEIAGRDVPYFGVLAATVTFAAVSLLGAWLLAKTDRS